MRFSLFFLTILSLAVWNTQAYLEKAQVAHAGAPGSDRMSRMSIHLGQYKIDATRALTNSNPVLFESNKVAFLAAIRKPQLPQTPVRLL